MLGWDKAASVLLPPSSLMFADLFLSRPFQNMFVKFLKSSTWKLKWSGVECADLGKADLFLRPGRGGPSLHIKGEDPP